MLSFSACSANDNARLTSGRVDEWQRTRHTCSGWRLLCRSLAIFSIYSMFQPTPIRVYVLLSINLLNAQGITKCRRIWGYFLMNAPFCVGRHSRNIECRKDSITMPMTLTSPTTLTTETWRIKNHENWSLSSEKKANNKSAYVLCRPCEVNCIYYWFFLGTLSNAWNASIYFSISSSFFLFSYSLKIAEPFDLAAFQVRRGRERLQC